MDLITYALSKKYIDKSIDDLKNNEGIKVPQKGVDYFTEADKQELVEDVLSALPVYDGEVETV